MNFTKFILLIFLSSLFASCEDFLDPEPTSAILVDEFYSSPAELELGVNAIIAAIQGDNASDFDQDNLRGMQIEYFVTEMLSDNTESRSPDPDSANAFREFENYTVNTNNAISANYYASMYRVIYLSNLVIDSIESGLVTDSSSEAEARFYRAFAYFNLIRLYGENSEDLGVPLIDHVLTEGEENLSYIRATEDEIYDLIISDFSLAASGLDDSSYNRASKSAAHTFLAKVYLTLDEPDYTSAILHLDQVYGNYSLLDNYADIFGQSNEGNDEIIYSIGYIETAEDGQNFSAEFLRQGDTTTGANYLSTDLHSALVESGGANRQLFGEDNFNTNETKYANLKHLSTSTGLDVDESINGGADWIVLRYADVILMYAEAYMGADDTLDVSIYPWGTDYNLIRTRAGLEEVTDITKDELLDERRYELYAENHRLFDLVRFGVADTVLAEYSRLNTRDFSTYEVNLPIPLREINLSPLDSDGNKLLIQNISWR